jgi:Tfp pilus assembly protein PilV
MGKLKKYLKGSTLMEVLVAMVILSLAWMFALSMIVKVGGESNTYQRVKAQLLVDSYFEAFAKNGKISDFGNTIDFKVVNTVLPYKSVQNVFVVKVEVFSKTGRSICERSKVIQLKLKNDAEK